jgi:protein-S-isoprenylcysteine O-methyltransferase Ste14
LGFAETGAVGALATGRALWLGGSGLALWALIVLGWLLVSGYRNPGAPRPLSFFAEPAVCGLYRRIARLGLGGQFSPSPDSRGVGVLPLALVPFAEEPWLLARYGAAYAEYLQSVARFVPLPHCREVA